MKQFNQTISVEVSVDTIADHLLSTFPEDYKHREMLTEAIIGSSLDSDKIGYIYNALNGYTNEINFKVGDSVFCTEKVYDYEGGEQKRREIDRCEVVEINLYAQSKLKVQYNVIKRNGEIGTETTWVSHKDCTLMY